ncbi:hypothetical protein OS493_038131 [Desmophyllum pertusum]|uniref:Uncharacterized protein n=1 Tax=Desmophyllum pertusum TaxID=174260 RepID=A0A9X0CUC1_9CNID|nr:hypothetical protein OS493_038131 [Desmophyllum pertusum]
MESEEEIVVGSEEILEVRSEEEMEMEVGAEAAEAENRCPIFNGNKSIFEVLAGLKSEVQDECFEALVNELKESSEGGTAHVVSRLLQGREAVSRPSRNDVLHIVSEKVGYCWRNMARELNNISEDEKMMDRNVAIRLCKHSVNNPP